MDHSEKELLPMDHDLINTQPHPGKEEAPANSSVFQIIRILNYGWLLIPLLLLEMDEGTRLAWSALMKTWQFWTVVLVLFLVNLVLRRKQIRLFFRSMK